MQLKEILKESNILYDPHGGAQSVNDYSIQPMAMKNTTDVNAMPYPQAWNAEEFDKLNSFAARKRYADQNLQRLSSGSARIVYKIDDEKVLKLAKNQKGIAQNELEADSFFRHYETAEVYNFDDEGKWIEMQLVKKISKKRFEQITGVPFDRFSHFIMVEYNRANPGQLLMQYKMDKEEYDKMVENEFVYSFIDMMIGFDMPPGDLMRISSYGETADGDVVLVDYGLNKSIGKEYYKHNYAKNDKNNVRDREDSFNMSEFLQIREEDRIRNYALRNLTKIGFESGRMMYEIDPNTILKIAKNDKGKKNNEVEANLESKGYPLPEVYNKSPDGLWIISEITRPVSKKQFKEITDISFNDFVKFVLYKATNKKIGGFENFEELNKNKHIMEFINVLKEGSVSPGVLTAINNFGLDKSNKIVLVDIGSSKLISNKLYGKKNVIKKMKKERKLNAMISNYTSHVNDMNAGGQNHAQKFQANEPVNSFTPGMIW